MGHERNDSDRSSWSIAVTDILLLGLPNSITSSGKTTYFFHSKSFTQIGQQRIFFPNAVSSQQPWLLPNEAYDKLTKIAIPPAGPVPDGASSEAELSPRIVRHVWSGSDTRKILSRCKDRGVGITQLISAAITVSSSRSSENHCESQDDLHRFDIHSAVDLTSRPGTSPSSADAQETALRVVLFSTVVTVPRANLSLRGHTDSLWDLARQYKERSATYVQSPHFWRFN
ncbi:hypothetical protein AcW1_002687 [Taiwanofungus camphoratus]|nr:hypothetical protein AcV5_009637 [Antrodia cinnamomea]KAI0942924.1 hypothetical protein AcV7_002206 [Antrodia cinnamomea]KAI0943550.1 hypothetical protein AcW1_002687 [Antrodia cinnamomea]